MIRWCVPWEWNAWTRDYTLDVHAVLREAGVRHVVGVDEAGRGPLAGPVTVAAVYFDLHQESLWSRVGDSKALAPRERAALEVALLAEVPALVVHMDERAISERNILGATMDGMEKAVRTLVAQLPDAADVPILVDGNRVPPALAGHAIPLIKGDARSRAIGAASILAKEARDRLMIEADARFPGYGFAKHKGYPTREHLEALQRLGPASIHRRGFGPVESAYRQGER